MFSAWRAESQFGFERRIIPLSEAQKLIIGQQDSRTYGHLGSLDAKRA
jgi:hypothetical protein